MMVPAQYVKKSNIEQIFSICIIYRIWRWLHFSRVGLLPQFMAKISRVTFIHIDIDFPNYEPSSESQDC